MTYLEYTFPSHELGPWDKSAVYHLEFTFTEQEARDFEMVSEIPGSLMRLIVTDEPWPQASFPPEWFTPPYAWHTLHGIARDQGHEMSASYGDDGVLSARCKLCGAGLHLRPDGIRERTAIDAPCLWLRREAQP